MSDSLSIASISMLDEDYNDDALSIDAMLSIMEEALQVGFAKKRRPTKTRVKLVDNSEGLMDSPETPVKPRKRLRCREVIPFRFSEVDSPMAGARQRKRAPKKKPNDAM